MVVSVYIGFDYVPSKPNRAPLKTIRKKLNSVKCCCVINILEVDVPWTHFHRKCDLSVSFKVVITRLAVMVL